MTEEKTGTLEHLKEQVGHALEAVYDTIGKYQHAISDQIARGFRPASDVTQEDKGVEVTLELPGLDAREIEIEAGDGWIAVSGHKKQERKTRTGSYLLSERYFGSFERRFALPGDVDPDKAKASFKDGVLTIKVPARPGARRSAKRIEVKTQ